MTNETQSTRAGDGKTLAMPYSMDLDPAGIRALVSDAISGALALGAQNESPAPEGHWLGHFWQLGRQHDEWRATVWAVARALSCLPSTYSDANGHVLRAAERLMAERAAVPAGQVLSPEWIENAWLSVCEAKQWERERLIAFARAVQAASTQLPDARSAFEAWAPSQHMRTERWTVNPELYDDEDAISAWQGFQAGAAWARSVPSPATVARSTE